MARRRVAILIAVITIALLGFVPSAAASHTVVEQGTWRGVVERHFNHFDYIGSPCPIQAQQCIQVIVRYRIVPVTWQAAFALPRVSGRQVFLRGALDPRPFRGHQGVLYVWRVSRPLS